VAESSGPERDELIGRVIASRYRLEKKLGSGAMGAVYRARHVKIDRAFAVKVLHVELLENAKLQRRFVREAELAGTLSHPNVVGVVDVGETPEGLHYIAMEYAEGPTLGDIMTRDAPLAAERVLEIVSRLCDGLHHAHERGLIHRDFKPDNVIVETREGREWPRIVDFGIAIVRDQTSSEERERLTTAGITLGTPHYMAPEHVTGQAIDHRIDLFALGVVVYEMLSGVMPFDGDGVDVARANLLEETPYMATRAPGVKVDPLLEAFTRKLLAKSPDARPPTAKAARELLDLIASDRPRAAAALGILLEDVPPVTPPPVLRQVPSYARYTPPTPFLAVPEPVRYSPSGQHAIVQNLAEPTDSGPLRASRERSVRSSQAPLRRTPTSSQPPLARPDLPAHPSGPYPIPIVSASPPHRSPTASGARLRQRRILLALAAAAAAIALGALLAVLFG
jgi:serine/threonine protein kinase